MVQPALLPEELVQSKEVVVPVAGPDTVEYRLPRVVRLYHELVGQWHAVMHGLPGPVRVADTLAYRPACHFLFIKVEPPP